jgi:hypothetical protein
MAIGFCLGQSTITGGLGTASPRTRLVGAVILESSDEANCQKGPGRSARLPGFRQAGSAMGLLVLSRRHD